MDTGDDRTIPFAEFVHTRTPTLFATAYLLTGQRDRAEDLLQETLTALYPQWHRVQAADRPVAYVRRCVTNRFVGHGRSGVSREVPTWELPEELDGTDIAERVVTGLTVWSVLGRLGERQRAALILRYFTNSPIWRSPRPSAAAAEPRAVWSAVAWSLFASCSTRRHPTAPIWEHSDERRPRLRVRAAGRSDPDRRRGATGPRAG